MKNVSLIFTVHEACGRASASALRAKLEQLQPDVIFLEAPEATFEEYFIAGTLRSLESDAVKGYRETRAVELVPVDLPTPGDEFFRNVRHLERTLKDRNPDYSRLTQWDSNYVFDYGFDYLNSERCSTMWTNIYAEMRRTIGAADDQDLTRIFEEWISTNGLREDAMIRSVEQYCSDHAVKQAVFLIGAAHRQSMIEKFAAFAAL
jgi:hypothetical protein